MIRSLTDTLFIEYHEGHHMKKIFLFIFLSGISGCLDFGEDVQTEKPTASQVSFCRKIMYLNPGLKITPLGFKLLGSGIDDAVWFKFKTEETSLSRIFDTTVMDVTGFAENFRFWSASDDLSWWDVENKIFTGGAVSLPAVKVMNVGLEKTETGYVVYIMWHET